MAIGAQEGFSWKGVAMGALAGGISSGLAGTQLLGGSGWQMTAVRMATANALTQGVAVATGLQKSFDWRGVAAAAVGGGVGAAVNGALGGYTLPEGIAGPQIPAAFSGLGEFGGALARGTLSGMAAGTAAAIARGGKVAIQQVAVDAFGNALGSSLADATRPSDPLGEFINEKLAEQDRRDRYGLATGVDPFGLRVGGGAGVQPSVSTMATWSKETDEGIAVAAQYLDNDWSMVPTAGGGARMSSRQGGSYRPGPLVQLARNEGREAFMSGMDDLTGFVGLMGDYRVLGNALQLGAQMQKNTTELAAIRKDLLELGKKPPMGDVDMYAPGEGARVLADKLTEHCNYVRLTLFERAGVLTLNNDFSIRTIGKDQLGPVEFANQLRGVYEAAVAQGTDIADARLRDGKLFVNTLKFGSAAEDIARGNFVDNFGKGAVRTWLDVQGVPEGQFGVVSINRRFTDTGNIDLYRMPDVLVNFGPRAILALDATLGTKTATTPQVRDSLRYGVTDWVNVTPGGSQWIKNPSVAPTYRWRLR